MIYCKDLIFQIKKIMGFRGVSNADMARKLNISRPAVTNRLRAGTNTTIHKLQQLADVLDCELRVEFIPKEIKYETSN